MVSKNVIFTILIATVFIVADVSICISESDAINSETDVTLNSNSIRLQIYGNANGDDFIDENDIKILNKIISEDIKDWKTQYPYADADQNNVVNKNDIDVIQKIINKENTKMYYLNWKDNVSYVNYPIGKNIMCDYSTFELLCATHTFENLMAIDQSAKIYIGKYDHLSDCKVISTSSDEHTIESLTAAMSEGVETLIQWTGGGAKDYLWTMDNINQLADELNIVSVPIQGPKCINGALMFTTMLGEPELSNDYKKWYEDAIGMFDSIGTDFEKKTVSCIRCFEKDVYGTYNMYGSKQSPALWFNQILNFQDQYVDKPGFTKLNSFEELVSTTTEEIVLMTQRRNGTTYEEFNDFAQERLDTLYNKTEQYENGKIYMIEWEAMPFFSGPAGCYILAAYLYPEHFNMDDALNFLQTYLDEFSPNENADARVGFTYSSAGPISPSTPDSQNNEDVKNDNNIAIYAGIAIVVTILIASLLIYKRNN